MDGKRTVWSVSSGEYSDYGVLGLFEHKADAEANAARNPGWRVEEFDLYAKGSPDVFQQVIEYSATTWVSREGKILDHVGVWSYHSWPEYADPPGVTYYVRESTFWMIGTATGQRRFQPEWPLGAKGYEVSAHVVGDEQRARKAVQERAAKVASIVIDGGDPTVLNGDNKAH